MRAREEHWNPLIDVVASLAGDIDDRGRRHRVHGPQLEPRCGACRGRAVDVTLLARFDERYADHAVAVARRIVYVVTGRLPGPLMV
jgi:phosphate uptake regulator